MHTTLTTKQKRVLQAIEQLTSQHGHCPSYRELMDELGYRSTGSIYRFVRSLKQKGWLQKVPRSWRSALPLRSGSEERGEGTTIEIIGRVSRQRPPELLPCSTKVSVPPQLAGATLSSYGLIVQDASFLEEHLLPGDLIIVGPTETIDPGELVLASTTFSIIGHFFEEGEQIRFRPSPYTHTASSQLFRGEEVQVWGVVTGLVRSYTSSFVGSSALPVDS